MGKGIALQFKQRFPEAFTAYRNACNAGEVRPGRVFAHPTKGQWILHVPTKRHWRDQARLDDVQAGVQDLARRITQLRIASVAVPALGCGLGGLRWEDVRPLIVSALEPTGARMLLYGPRP
ncbi:appr-1-p processing domain-containing protein [Micromonospora fluostatini]|uniref:Appr-1-p processing domain-containing protein n=2 Tax=Micromonospora TaxID=1873 RepID=A0ABY2DLH7_9ACTN|nr:appr-1-p processing domain-containing protein [Micromonospora fluostatini]